MVCASTRRHSALELRNARPLDKKSSSENVRHSRDIGVIDIWSCQTYHCFIL
jgi:hypothetical protein